jgi:ABC-type branched-subunit amino acid transport system ATPase component/ABC-type branched-subunit amino acid transport system permease subunit
MTGPTRGERLALWTTAAIVFGGLLLLPSTASSFTVSNTTFFLVSVPLVLGLALLWGHCGILSFGQVAFLGIAGYAYAVIMGNVSEEWIWTVIAAASALLLVAIVSTFFAYFVFYGRVSSWITPILTLALTLVLELFLGQTSGYQWRIGTALLGGFNGMNLIPSLKIGGREFSVFDNSLFYLATTICLLLFVGLELFGRTRAGAIVRSIRDDPERAELLGHNVRLIQTIVFVVSAILAGVSGLLYVWWGNYIDPSSFGLINATLPVIYAVVGGKESFLCVTVATLWLGYLADALSAQGGQYAFVVNGALLLAAMLFFPNGIILELGKWLFAAGRRLARGTIVSSGEEVMASDGGREASAGALSIQMNVAGSPAANGSPVLSVDAVSKRFGGLVAVDELTLSVKSGEICCIVGPNGAGKSTLFNLISGRLMQDSGTITFAGRDLRPLQPHERCHLGLAIKFQSSRVFSTLSVAENLLVAGRQEIGEVARSMLASYGLSVVGDDLAADLGPVQRQVLELVMVLRSGPQLLMLDEPTVGMTAPDVRALAQVIRSLPGMHITLLIVEHDMEFVRLVADRIIVMHRGRYYAAGSVSEIEQHAGVREIYLGSM